MTIERVQLHPASRGAVLLGRCKVATQPPALDIPEPELQELCIGSILEIGHLLVASLAQHLWQRERL